MSDRHVPRALALLLALVPGWGHIVLGREALGVVVFTVFALSGFGLLNALWIHVGDHGQVLVVITAISTVASLIYSFIDVLVRTSPERLRRSRRVRDHLLWEGTLYFLRGDFLAAEQKFLESCRQDALDVESAFRAGVAAARRGEAAEARRRLDRARQLDIDEKWRWEIERELGRLERTGSREDTNAPVAEDRAAAATGQS